MIKILPFFILIFFAFHFSFGQNTRLKGTIVADSLQGFAINIVNYTKKIGTTNDQSGFFDIPASANDSIIFSSVQYKVVSIIVSEDDLDKETFKIKLFPVIQKLDQVNVSNVKLSGDITKDAKDIQIKPHIDNRVLGLPVRNIKQPTLEVRRIYTASSGPVDLLLNTLNGRLKKLKKLKELADLESLIEKGERAFDTTFFTEDLGLPENLISDFVYYCSEDEYFENLLENTKRLSLLEFFQKKSKEYKVHKEID
ncbi:hypothetical protein [Aquimarina litoralis]|uniref:hypothetical protein n=1 Tax=Aquimarina litoralis TaxID=584605 RepID=UPI001C59AB0E|nr:hypothetical protein [Aquimarina litoralis]MBW1297135.1 hypothetical protein [Aquimarina litoralis]